MVTRRGFIGFLSLGFGLFAVKTKAGFLAGLSSTNAPEKRHTVRYELLLPHVRGNKEFENALATIYRPDAVAEFKNKMMALGILSSVTVEAHVPKLIVEFHCKSAEACREFLRHADESGLVEKRALDAYNGKLERSSFV